MAEATRRVGRPRTRSEGPGDYVGFRVPRELKRRLEEAAERSGRSLSTETQIRLEKSFDQQDILTQAIELKYGHRVTGILLLLLEEVTRAGELGALTSSSEPFELNPDKLRRSFETMKNWIDDPYAYEQAVQAALCVLHAFRPDGDPNTLQRGGPASMVLGAAAQVSEELACLRDPQAADSRAQEASRLPPLSSLLSAPRRMNPKQEERMRALLGPLVERIPYRIEQNHDA